MKKYCYIFLTIGLLFTNFSCAVIETGIYKPTEASTAVFSQQWEVQSEVTYATSLAGSFRMGFSPLKNISINYIQMSAVPRRGYAEGTLGYYWRASDRHLMELRAGFGQGEINWREGNRQEGYRKANGNYDKFFVQILYELSGKNTWGFNMRTGWMNMKSYQFFVNRVEASNEFKIAFAEPTIYFRKSSKIKLGGTFNWILFGNMPLVYDFQAGKNRLPFEGFPQLGLGVSVFLHGK